MIENIQNWLSQPWPWYVAGPIIGLMVPLLLLWDNKHFGISSTYRDFCAYVLPNLKGGYFKYNLKEHTWRNVYVAGIVLGAIFSAIFLSNAQNVNISQQTVIDLSGLGITSFEGLAPSEIFSWNNLFTIKGLIFIVVGGFFVGFGTRYADGCTSGHAITGLSLFSKGSLVAVIGFFIGGLVSTHLILPIIMGN